MARVGPQLHTKKREVSRCILSAFSEFHNTPSEKRFSYYYEHDGTL